MSSVWQVRIKYLTHFRYVLTYHLAFGSVQFVLAYHFFSFQNVFHSVSFLARAPPAQERVDRVCIWRKFELDMRDDFSSNFLV